MSIIVTAIFHPKPGRRDELIAAMHPAIAAVHAEPGCELYAIHDAADGTITMLEKWRSVEDLDAHASGDAIGMLNEAIDGLLAAPVVVTRMTAIPSGGPAGTL